MKVVKGYDYVEYDGVYHVFEKPEDQSRLSLKECKYVRTSKEVLYCHPDGSIDKTFATRRKEIR